jgi:hypothetical protein
MAKLTGFCSLVAALFVGLTLTAAPAAVAADLDSVWPFGFTQGTTVCVIHADPAAHWRVAGAMKAWNEAQDHVIFSNVATPGCELITIHEFDNSQAPGANGFISLYSDATTNNIMQREIWLNRQVRDETIKPYWRGDHMGCFRKSVVTHELGHALGLGVPYHTHGTQSVMSSDRDWLSNCGRPFAADVRTLDALYAGSQAAPRLGPSRGQLATPTDVRHLALYH